MFRTSYHSSGLEPRRISLDPARVSASPLPTSTTPDRLGEQSSHNHINSDQKEKKNDNYEYTQKYKRTKMATKRPAADPPSSPHSTSFSDEENEPNLTPSSPAPSSKPLSDRHSDDDSDPNLKSLSTEDDRDGLEPELEVDSETDQSDSRPTPPPQRPARGVDPSIKPIKSLPMDAITGPVSVAPPPSQPRSKRLKVSSSTSSVSASAGRSGGKKRLWSPEDELTVIRGLLSYRAKKGVLPGPAQEMEAFHRLIRSSLSIKVSTLIIN
jgi:Protein of unknown function, DUF573